VIAKVIRFSVENAKVAHDLDCLANGQMRDFSEMKEMEIAFFAQGVRDFAFDLTVQSGVE
jgi:hypothetical protein